MRAVKVINTLKIGNNTAIILDDKCKDIKNGTAILDDKGKPYIILSVGMDSSKGSLEKASVLIEGSFKSEKIYY